MTIPIQTQKAKWVFFWAEAPFHNILFRLLRKLIIILIYNISYRLNVNNLLRKLFPLSNCIFQSTQLRWVFWNMAKLFPKTLNGKGGTVCYVRRVYILRHDQA